MSAPFIGDDLPVVIGDVHCELLRVECLPRQEIAYLIDCTALHVLREPCDGHCVGAASEDRHDDKS